MCAIINTSRHFWFRTDISPQLVSQLKKVSNEKRLEILSTQYNYQQNREYNNLQALQRNQITDMRNIVNFQSHTLFHPILPMCKDDDARFEIFHSKYILENEYGLKINAIAYPNGDYSERDIQIVKKAGYKCGITVDYGFNSIETDLFKLKRISVNDTKDINELIVKSSGLWAFLKTLLLKKQKNNYANWEV
jgi:poly-beta-1,6-N-acetyl-D-glucosamine N-deacetylase